jgi:hypothetical protein
VRKGIAAALIMVLSLARFVAYLHHRSHLKSTSLIHRIHVNTDASSGQSLGSLTLGWSGAVPR